MLHARDDYDRIQDPALQDPSLLAEGATPIGADEPVMLFRAQDKHFKAVLWEYRKLVMADDTSPLEQRAAIADALDAQIVRAALWQREHGCKSPDL